MERLLNILPALGVAAYMTGLEVGGYDLLFMRALSLVLALVLVPTVVLGLRRGVLPDIGLGLDMGSTVEFYYLILLFFLAQRYFIRGISVTGLAGR